MNGVRQSDSGISSIRLFVYVAVHALGILGPFCVETTPGTLTLFIALYFLRMFGVTGGYHRYFAHRSFKTSRAFQFVLACLGATAAQKGVLWWSAWHRHHHLHSDTQADLHSPKQHGVLYAHLGWFLSRQCQWTEQNSVPDLARFPELRWLDRFHYVPPALLAAFAYVGWGMTGLVWGFGVSTVCCWHATYFINSIAHLVGARRFETADESRNSLLLALITMGEGWHNNHHFYPTSARQGFYAWEIDMTYYLLRGLNVLGLIWDLRGVPERVYETAIKTEKRN